TKPMPAVLSSGSPGTRDPELILVKSRWSFLCHIIPSPGRIGKGEGAERVMVYYRLYLLHPDDGRFVGFEEIEAHDEVEAVHMAKNFGGNQPLELWCGKRKVNSFPARTVAAEG
ncbi:MAG: hypothetical protein ACXW2T_11075, partial [Allosphingosinicella sp.]